MKRNGEIGPVAEQAALVNPRQMFSLN
jgi:hypothetical protein